MDADRPTVPDQVRRDGGSPTDASETRRDPAAPRRPRPVADAMALLAVSFAVLGWVGVACGLGMAVTARTSPEGMAGFAAYVWLVLVSPVAVLATALAAIARYLRGSHRAATALGALALGGVVWLCLLWLAA